MTRCRDCRFWLTFGERITAIGRCGIILPPGLDRARPNERTTPGGGGCDLGQPHASDKGAADADS